MTTADLLSQLPVILVAVIAIVIVIVIVIIVTHLYISPMEPLR
jgi:hypothetical protein